MVVLFHGRRYERIRHSADAAVCVGCAPGRRHSRRARACYLGAARSRTRRTRLLPAHAVAPAATLATPLRVRGSVGATRQNQSVLMGLLTARCSLRTWLCVLYRGR